MNKRSTQSGVISSILGGWSDLQNMGSAGEFLASLGIDPEDNLELTKASGVIAPSRFSKFSGGQLTSAPMWISGAATSAGVFVLGMDGSLIAYSSTLGSETDLGNPNSSGASGNGMAVWNDYVYCALDTTIARWGQVSATGGAFTTDYWVSGLSMSALTNSQYPGTRSVDFPNHVLYPHNDGRMYVLDYDGANGRIHSFTTDANGTNGSGRFNDVTLPPGLMPMAAAPYGTDIAVVCSPAALYVTGDIPKPGNALLAFWDGIPTHAPYRYVPINEPMATAIANKNGELYIWAGNIDTEVKVLKYLGGYSFETVATIPDSSPPPAGAVDSSGNMLAWGGYTTYPTTAAGVFTVGFRSGKLPGASVQHIARSTSVGTLPIVSAMKFIQRNRAPVIGWQDGTPTYGIDKRAGSGSYNSIFRSLPILLGRKFIVRRLVIPLSSNVQAGVIITPTIYVDNETASTDLTVINSTNFASNETSIDLQGLTVTGNHSFYVQFAFTGTQEIGIMLPVYYEYDFID